MNNKKLLVLSVILFSVLVFFAAPSYASITLAPDFEGTVLITSPSGEITLLQPGDAVPAIPSGSSLQVYKGQLTVTTGEGEQVKLSCLSSSTAVGGGSSATLSCGKDSEDSGLLKVLKGSVVVTVDGKESTLKEGSEFPIKGGKQEAPPTSAGEEPLGGQPVGGEIGDAPPVDSRNIQSSPSQ